ncbi:MAG: septum formation initiator family protein [Candidatus Staskawiczbacteria bacterium]|nr:septum formation initiator family protein [Candidatus Staskawiczbacteria bacterium]
MNVRVYKEKRKFDLQVVSLEKKIEGLRQKNSQLEQKIARSDDKDYIEKIAREELNLQMPSEKVITFLLPELQQGEINSSGSFLNIKNWLGWISNSWQWVINFSK